MKKSHYHCLGIVLFSSLLWLTTPRVLANDVTDSSINQTPADTNLSQASPATSDSGLNTAIVQAVKLKKKVSLSLKHLRRLSPVRKL